MTSARKSGQLSLKTPSSHSLMRGSSTWLSQSSPLCNIVTFSTQISMKILPESFLVTRLIYSFKLINWSITVPNRWYNSKLTRVVLCPKISTWSLRNKRLRVKDCTSPSFTRLPTNAHWLHSKVETQRQEEM